MSTHLAIEILPDIMQEFKMPKPVEKESLVLTQFIKEAEESFFKKDFTKASRQYQKLLRKPAHVYQSSLFASRLGQCHRSRSALKANSIDDYAAMRFFTLAHLLDKTRPEIAFFLAKILFLLKKNTEAYEKIAQYTIGEGNYIPLSHPSQNKATDQKSSEPTSSTETTKSNVTVSKETMALRNKTFESFSMLDMDTLRLQLICYNKPALSILDTVWSQCKSFYGAEHQLIKDFEQPIQKLRTKLLEATTSTNASSETAAIPVVVAPTVTTASVHTIPNTPTVSYPASEEIKTQHSKSTSISEIISKSNQLVSKTKLDDTYVPRFRIRVHQQGLVVSIRLYEFVMFFFLNLYYIV